MNIIVLSLLIDDIGIWVNQDSYDKIIAAVGGLYNKESSQLSPKAYQ